jgi:hypothetical protein
MFLFPLNVKEYHIYSLQIRTTLSMQFQTQLNNVILAKHQIVADELQCCVNEFQHFAKDDLFYLHETKLHTI